MISVRRVAMAGVLAACSTLPYPPKPIAGADTPPIVEPLAPAIALGADSLQVADYGVAPTLRASDATSDRIAELLVARVRGRATLTRDPRLDLAAAELAEVVDRGGSLGDEAVAFALREHGVLESAVRVASSRATTPDARARELDPQLAEVIVRPDMQFGVGGHASRVVVVTNPITVRLTQPLPRSLPSAGVAQLDAVLDSRLHAPHVAFTHEDTTVDHPHMFAAGDHRFHAELACGAHRGTQWLAIDACDASNVQHLVAVIPIECAEPPPDTLLIEPDANLVTSDPARRLTSIINRERRKYGFHALRGDIRLDRVARAHADAIAKAREVSHDRGGSPERRLYDAGLFPPVSVETALANANLGRVAAQLMNEPGYRSAVAREDLTHVGVALATGADHQLYAVVELAGIPPRVPEDRVKALVADLLGYGRPIGGPEGDLPAIARRAVEARASGATKEQIADYVITSAKADRCTSTSFIYVNFPSLAAITADALEVRAYFTDLGIGVYQQAPGGTMPGWIWVAIVYGAHCK